MTEQEGRPSLADRVRAARIERDWSKEEAARQAGISAITWKRIEDGLRVQEGKLAAALRALGMAEEGQPESLPLPDGARPIGDPADDLVEFDVRGSFGVRAVVRGPIRDIEALQEAVSRLIANMPNGEAETGD